MGITDAIQIYLDRQGFSIKTTNRGFDEKSSLEIAELLHEKDMTLIELHNIAKIILELEEKDLIYDIPSLSVIGRMNRPIPFINWIMQNKRI